MFLLKLGFSSSVSENAPSNDSKLLCSRLISKFICPFDLSLTFRFIVCVRIIFEKSLFDSWHQIQELSLFAAFKPKQKIFFNIIKKKKRMAENITQNKQQKLHVTTQPIFDLIRYSVDIDFISIFQEFHQFSQCLPQTRITFRFYFKHS